MVPKSPGIGTQNGRIQTADTLSPRPAAAMSPAGTKHQGLGKGLRKE